MTYTHIKRFKRGAYWEPGKPRYCTRCGAEKRPRRNQAVVTAVVNHNGYKLPVGYCTEHVPDNLMEEG